MIKIKKGLDLPIEGTPEQKIYDAASVTKVAIIGDDVVGMKPTMMVKVGDTVKKGQVLFTDKKTEGVQYTAPASGEVLEVNRGAKRAFQSVVIKITGDDSVTFNSHKGSDVSSYSADDVAALLQESGMWPSLRQRPFSKAAAPGTKPQALIINAMDTNPLAADADLIIESQKDAFAVGMKALSMLAPKTFVATKPNSVVTTTEGVVKEEFSGPHPAGLSGTHIHFLAPVNENNITWYINYQEVIAIGHLIQTGSLFTQRVISIAGPAAKNPRLVKTRVGACIDELVADEKNTTDETRAVSGSVFGGRDASGPFAYLGRFHHQVSLLKEGRKREFLGWHSPGFNRFSVKSIYLSKLMGGRKFSFDTDENGSLRSIVPIGSYEKVMPLDILPTHLVRLLYSTNNEMLVKLGILELDEEDLSLLTFVDPCKNDFGPRLREKLTIIEKEG
ncbi:MAG: Na(+)-translocating NADH-quinone reductase subunit A [Bacteriovoracaceae bacterium]|jgi:Na+-transporting NADH:ubiquinone oxidoreductase subunit A|nr:Na(+)-translocating NADH-quinone reductase subunit A [Bacteriovoracaceae bacterium]